MCVMAPPIHLGAWSMGYGSLFRFEAVLAVEGPPRACDIGVALAVQCEAMHGVIPASRACRRIPLRVLHFSAIHYCVAASLFLVTYVDSRVLFWAHDQESPFVTLIIISGHHFGTALLIYLTDHERSRLAVSAR